MAGTDITIFAAYGAAVVLAVVATVAIAASTGRPRTVDRHGLAEFEKRWLLIVVALLVALLAAIGGVVNAVRMLRLPDPAPTAADAMVVG